MSNIDKNEFRKYAVKHHRINGLHVDKFIGGVEKSTYYPTGINNYDALYHRRAPA